MNLTRCRTESVYVGFQRALAPLLAGVMVPDHAFTVEGVSTVLNDEDETFLGLDYPLQTDHARGTFERRAHVVSALKATAEVLVAFICSIAYVNDCVLFF